MKILKFLQKIAPGNTLYYPGCLTKFVAKNLLENYRKLLRQSKIDFIELSNLEVCCGSPVLKAGGLKEFKKLAQNNLKIFKEHNVATIITNCPACYKTMARDYGEVLGNEWNIKVQHTTKIKLKTSYPLPATSYQVSVVYHDPCHLGKEMEIYEEPRRIIKHAGYKIKEMKLRKKQSFCCGGGGGVKANYPQLADKIAKERIRQAKQTKAEILCTACPLCYLHLKENAENIKVKEISEILLMN